MLSVSVIIPTKNRLDDLIHAVESLKLQSRMPNELLIIDQSDNDDSMQEIQRIWDVKDQCDLIYVYDKSITGLVDAKRVAIGKASGDIMCFLEDDIVLDEEYILNTVALFENSSSIMGSCGVVTSGAKSSQLYVAFFHFFHRGIFKDRRVGIHGNQAVFDTEPVNSNFLSGGLSAYRKDVFEVIPFDVENKFFALEDIEFSTRAARYFGKNNFFINPTAKLEHHMSPVNRSGLGVRYRRKFKEFIIFYKKNKMEPFALLSLMWLFTGLYLESGVTAALHLSKGPLVGSFQGMIDGINWKIKS